MAAPVAHDGYGRVAKRLARWAMWPIGLFALCALPQVFVSLMGHGDFVRLDLANLGTACELFRQQHGHWPEETHWAQQLVDAQILKRQPLDPWDRPYQYRLVSTDGGGLVPQFMSIGRDGVAGTEDDVQ